MSTDVKATDDVADVASETDAVRSVGDAERKEISAAESKAGGVKMIAIGLITKSEASLRDVNTSNEEYQALVQSVAKKGILNSILVRELNTDANGVTHYGLIDGLQRFTAAGDVGLSEVPARIVAMDDAEILEAQIITNMSRVATKPAELSKHLLRILTRNPLLTKSQLAARVCQSETWLNQRLSLNKLSEPIQELVNTEQINLSNAYALSKLPEEEQKEHVDAAMTESPRTFVTRMKERNKEIKDANKAGRDAGSAKFQPTMHMQKVADVKTEYAILIGEEKGTAILPGVLKDAGIKVDMDALKLIVAWMLHFDPASKEAQVKRADEQKKRREDEKARLKKENEEKKQKRAAEAAADLNKGF